MKFRSHHEPFRSALDAFNSEIKDRFRGEEKMRIDYQREW